MGSHDTEEISFSVSNLTLCSIPPVHTPRASINQCSLSVVSQPRRNTWYDLPLEVLVLIARYTIIPYETISTDQYPRLDEIDSIFATIDKRTRRAFFSAVQQDCVFINLLFYNAQCSDAAPTFTAALEKYFPSQRSFNLSNTALLTGYETSSVRIQLYENLAKCEWRTGNVVICATSWNVTLMRSFLVAQRRLYKNIIVDCCSLTRDRATDVQTIVQDTGDFTRGMMYAGVYSSYNVMPITQAGFLALRMMQPLTYWPAFAIHEKHLHCIKETMKLKNIQTILPYIADATLDHIRIFGTLRLPTQALTEVARQRALYITLLFKALAAFLLTRPNTIEQQSHCLFVEGSQGDTLLRECLATIRRVHFILEDWDWSRTYDRETEVILEATFAVLQARSEYEIALARTASLPGAKKMGRYVKRGRFHVMKKLGVRGHIEISQFYQIKLSEMYVARLGRASNVTTGLSSYHKWSDVMIGLTYEADKAAEMRKSRFKWNRGAILVEPIGQRCVEMLQCNWMFSDG